jgi:hypothetical protein
VRRHTSRGNGDLDLTYIEGVCADIALALRDKAGFTAIVVRSTVAGTIVIGNRDRYFCEVVGRLKHGAARGGSTRTARTMASAGNRLARISHTE